MKRAPQIVDVLAVIKGAEDVQTSLPDGHWVPARAFGLDTLGNRLRAAWMVFTGRADALTWPGQ